MKVCLIRRRCEVGEEAEFRPELLSGNYLLRQVQ